MSCGTIAMSARRLSCVTSRMSCPSIGDAPALHVIETLQQRQHRGLAGAREADQPDALPRLDGEVEAVQHRRPARIGEAHVLEAHAARAGDARPRIRAVGQLMLGPAATPTASSSRDRCCVRSTSATARSRVPCRMPKASEVISTMSPTVACAVLPQQQRPRRRCRRSAARSAPHASAAAAPCRAGCAVRAPISERSVPAKRRCSRKVAPKARTTPILPTTSTSSPSTAAACRAKSRCSGVPLRARK